MPNIVGSIDGTYISIIVPAEQASDYYSQYQHHSIVCQCIADAAMKLISVSIDFTRSMHDASIL